MRDHIRDPDGVVHEIQTLVLWRRNRTRTICGESKRTSALVETDEAPTCLYCVGAIH